jgi:phenylacetate-CoA ligase
MIPTLYRRVLLPAYEGGIKRRKTFRYWSELARSQWLPRAEVDSLQFEALRRLVAYAEVNCPYYRETWGELGLGSAALHGPDDFRRWPVIDREVIGRERVRMRTTEPGARIRAKSTGGSTGTPLHFDLDDESLDRRNAAWHRGYDWAGAGPGTRQFYLWGVPLGVRPRWKVWKDEVYNRLIYRRLVVNTFELSDATAPDILRRLNRHRPEVIVAYTNPLYVFARWLDGRGLTVARPRSIVVGAEKLHDFQRTLIERVFDAPVFETYGSREFMLIGAECDRHEGLHLTEENLLVEVLDEAGRPTPDGEEGDVVVTDLTNRGMPFIRYANGDRAVAGWGDCTCGRGLPLLRKVVGRRLDVLQTPDGRRVPGEFFPHLIKDFAAVRRFQVVQEAPDSVELRLVLNGALGEPERRRLEQEIVGVLGPAVRFRVRTVDEIPLTSAGKHRVVVNLCGAPAAPADQPA